MAYKNTIQKVQLTVSVKAKNLAVVLKVTSCWIYHHLIVTLPPCSLDFNVPVQT